MLDAQTETASHPLAGCRRRDLSHWRIVTFSVLGLSLAGCAADTAMVPLQPAATPAKTTAVPVTPEALVGRWGLASYLQEKDKARTEKEARSQCNKPYIIGKGAHGGVMMHLADEKEPQELEVKTAPDGSVFIGPDGPPDLQEDRTVTAFDGNMLVSGWVDPSVAERYGTMVFVRCKSK